VTGPEALSALFLRFLKFGALAWGGPVAQIAMLRQELVEEEGWVSRDHFNRVLALYQVLPGPEAHELCVYFGTLARGPIGGILAGLGFMLPGFLLMFGLSALYVRGLTASPLQAVFLGMQPAVVALIVRAVHRIGLHALTSGWLIGTAAAAFAAQTAGIPFWVTLPVCGAAGALAVSRRRLLGGAALTVLLGLAIAAFARPVLPDVPGLTDPARGAAAEPAVPPAPGRLFAAGLRAGLLTFGGAYTVLPFLQRDAVEVGKWMTNAEFLDGVALSGILPAPFIIFATFVGYLGGGPLGALLLTAAIFLPAFAFTLVAHERMEQIVARRHVRPFLDGVTAGVVGIIGALAVELLLGSVRTPWAAVVFGVALLVLYRWRAKGAVAAVMAGAGVLGALAVR